MIEKLLCLEGVGNMKRLGLLLVVLLASVIIGAQPLHASQPLFEHHGIVWVIGYFMQHWNSFTSLGAASLDPSVVDNNGGRAVLGGDADDYSHGKGDLDSGPVVERSVLSFTLVERLSGKQANEKFNSK